MWRKSLLLKYIGLPIPFFKSKFNFSQTVGEMIFVSFEVEKISENVFSSVSSSLVLCLSAVVGCSSNFFLNTPDILSIFLKFSNSCGRLLPMARKVVNT